ncbi:MAG: hypothetical protein A3H98_07615 [Bacteroidetes bacterium RIFCSPLOWO2_02_FULL_36_8]|nr:MAG: hypothetical protein A3H98_07615 [Bacteroidetes bacterium RIFCSPLOWO2_02_FULL_36_8]OFY71973.1 MAG: hypothetical protein A3G23_00060 [Bacteroidetes bacterium RIFCSPLOWO2_12_FULL_37_12]
MPKARNITVNELMKREVITLDEEMPILTAVGKLLKNKISGAPVLNEKKEVVGLLSEKDCLCILTQGTFHNLPSKRVSQYMTRNVKTVHSTLDIIEMAELFIKTHFRRYPVVDDGKLVGTISRRDVLRVINEKM